MAARIVAFVDRRSGLAFDMEVPETSPWWPLLPERQEAEIVATNNNEARSSAPAAHEREAVTDAAQ